MYFLNDSHKSKFNSISKFYPQMLAYCDNERISLFYIISGNDDLYRKKHVLYDFINNHLIFESFNSTNTDFCSSSKALIRLALNLFNGYSDTFTSPLQILGCLGSNNYKLAITAIKLRFKYF
jgi:hypothetical protein